MKFKLQAGAEFDMLTKDELHGEMRRFMADWMVEAARGPRSVRFSAMGTIAADATLTLGGTTSTLTSGRLGPDQSMVWSVKRWALTGLAAGETVTAYVNNDQPNSVIMPGVGPGVERWGSDSLVLQGGDVLLFAGSGLLSPAGTAVFVTGQAWELPATLMWRLL